jgi:hypothetical protein
MIQTNPTKLNYLWLPPFDEVPAPQHFHVKAKRSIKRAMDKVRARRAEDRHIMELAEYYHPFLEA